MPARKQKRWENTVPVDENGLRVIDGKQPGEPYDEEVKARLKDRFVANYALSGVIRTACFVTGITRATVRQWCETDVSFLFRLEMAFEDSVDLLEQEATERALASSDRLLKFMISRGRPFPALRRQLRLQQRKTPGKVSPGTQGQPPKEEIQPPPLSPSLEIQEGDED